MFTLLSRKAKTGYRSFNLLTNLLRTTHSEHQRDHLAQSARNVSIKHPKHGALYGPFFRQATGQSPKTPRLLIDNLTKPEAGDNHVQGYYPNLYSQFADFDRILNFIRGGRVAHSGHVFYTPIKPDVLHEQLPGVEMAWPKEKLKDGKLPLHSALVIKEGEVFSASKVLSQHFKAHMQKANEMYGDIEYRTLTEDCINDIFKHAKELDADCETDASPTSPNNS